MRYIFQSILIAIKILLFGSGLPYIVTAISSRQYDVRYWYDEEIYLFLILFVLQILFFGIGFLALNNKK